MFADFLCFGVYSKHLLICDDVLLCRNDPEYPYVCSSLFLAAVLLTGSKTASFETPAY